MAAAEAWAREVGVLKLELHVFPHNDAAIALYEGWATSARATAATTTGAATATLTRS